MDGERCHAVRRAQRNVPGGADGVDYRRGIVWGRPRGEHRLHSERRHESLRNVRPGDRGEPALMRRRHSRPRFRSLVDERGSVLVMGLMLVFVMTLLGLALFNVARLDARLKLDSQTTVQALEIAEAGLERGLHLFYLEFTCGPLVTSPITAANCANPPANPNYITDNKLARISLATACPASLLPDGATGFKQLVLNQTFAGGTYTVCIRPDPDAPTNQLKAQLRSRGVLTAITGTAAHIVQINATAIVTANKPHAPFAIGGPTGGAFRGGARIAGSLQFVKCPGAGCVAANFSGNSGIQNNYNGLNAGLHDRIPWKYADNTTVNTLGAVLKVKEGEIQVTANSACVGGPESGGGSCGNTPPQDTLSGVYSSGTWSGSQGRCSPAQGGLNGATTTNSRCNVWTSAQGAYPPGEPAAIPLLSDSTIIDGVGYRCFFNPAGSTCPNSTDPARSRTDQRISEAPRHGAGGDADVYDVTSERGDRQQHVLPGQGHHRRRQPRRHTGVRDRHGPLVGYHRQPGMGRVRRRRLSVRLPLSGESLPRHAHHRRHQARGRPRAQHPRHVLCSQHRSHGQVLRNRSYRHRAGRGPRIRTAV